MRGLFRKRNKMKKKITIKSKLGALSWQQWSEMSDKERLDHSKYIDELKQEGDFGKEIETKFNFQGVPEFDTPVGEMKFEILIPKGMYRDGKKPDLPKLRLKDLGLRSDIPEENE